MAGRIRVGIGGWTFKPWRGTFYPDRLTQKRELEYASRALTSIEINGTYYSTFKPDSWRKWHDETPDDFVFSVKASRYSTNRKVLADGADSINRFLAQGLTELGSKLGPINWQFMATKKFDADDFGAFLALLPRERDQLELRHAVEVRHPSFATEEFYDLARAHNVAIIFAQDEKFPAINETTADFTYARLMSTEAGNAFGVTPQELKQRTKEAQTWAANGDTFIYFISGAKERNPDAARALLAELGDLPDVPLDIQSSKPATEKKK